MNSLPPIIQSLLNWLVTLLTPLALLMTVLRFLLTPMFVQIEYRTPNFPPDPYGFTQDERLKWSAYALDFLLNEEGEDYLGDLEFEDSSPLYDERELKHMVDVKVLVQAGLKVWYGILSFLILLGVWAWRAGWWSEYKMMLASGGKFTMVLILGLILLVFINFDQVFTGFHRIFFEGDTWLFYYSDTLIRLFPIRFWRDAFITAGVLTFGGAFALWYFFERKPKS